MGVEAAVRQADLLHNVGDARAVVAASPNGARGGPDDPFVGDFLAAWGGPLSGGRSHMMSIIYQSDAERNCSTRGRSARSPATWGTLARRGWGRCTGTGARSGTRPKRWRLSRLVQVVKERSKRIPAAMNRLGLTQASL